MSSKAAVLLVGLAYFLIGRLFAVPATYAQAWRWAAWLVSGACFAAQIGYEHFRLRNPPFTIARHAALAAAIGAFALALAGALHSLSSSSGVRPLWLLALVLWPVFTAVPAFLVALGAAGVLARLAKPADPR